MTIYKGVYLNDVGLVNALGCGKEEVYKNLISGFSEGMRESTEWLQGRSTIVADVSAALPALPQKFLDQDTRTHRLLLCALQQLQPSLELLIKRYGTARIGVVIGTSTSGIAEGEAYVADYLANPDLPVSSYHYRKQEIGAPALFIANYLDIGGPCMTVSTACSSSAKVLATAQNWLQMNLCDVVIAGGADSLCRLTVNGFHALGLVSDQVCKPFQADRNGINIGEAAALFVVSREPSAIQLLAVGESSDAYHISAPHPEGDGAERSMRNALNDAGVKTTDVDYINLHGTATLANDQAESQAVARIFGSRVPCSSTKALTGHTLGAAGATEVGFCWLLLDAMNRDGILPMQSDHPVYDTKLPSIGLLTTSAKLPKKPYNTMLSNSFAFGGSNVSVILQKDNSFR